MSATGTAGAAGGTGASVAVPPPGSPSLYDARTAELSVAGDVKMALAGALVGVLLLLLVRQRKDRASKAFALFWIAASVAFGAWGASRTVADHRAGAALLSAGRVSVAEGEVTAFVPAARGKDGAQSFVVSGKAFRVPGGGERGPGLHVVSDADGPVREGRRLKVYFAGEAILRLEELRDSPAVSGSNAGVQSERSGAASP